MDEDVPEAGPSTENHDQVIPVSASTSATCISSVSNFQTDTFYCDSQEVLDNANLMVFEPLQDAAKIVVPHTLSFELLHYFGPFTTNFGTNYVYVASCENDSSRNILVCQYVTTSENVQLDYYLNRTFKIKNFMTISSKKVFFHCGKFGFTT